ncbi:oxygenase MpaB family protein [Pseudonocardia sp. RS010]|uniref:oxygenase MpaB family protein n=1 Tax=Pseudonocardia sp. RS010 TaxID=3385979 RepID=UPI00399FFB6A
MTVDTALRTDHGLFGPESVTWRVHLEPVLWVAGMRALLLQSLHPWVMRGTFQNSALFDPAKAWPRFQRTVEFVGTRTFGSRAEVEAAGARVRRLHHKLRGVDPESGRGFPIDAPEGLLWVHCGEIDSYVDVARRAGIVTAAEADAYVAESVRAAEVVGLDPAAVPASRAELAAYFARMRPRLRVTDEARVAVGGLLAPPAGAPTWTRTAISATATTALATLPRWARRMYGLPGLPTTDLAASALLAGLRRATHLLPDPPAPPEVREARRLVRLARAGEPG